MRLRAPVVAAGLAAAALAIAAGPAAALPVLGPETPRGTGTFERLPAVAPTVKHVDGLIGDWRGRRPRFGGVTVRSAGELIYIDHLFDAFGADDGRDAERLAASRPVDDGLPESYRLHALAENAAGQSPVETPEQLRYRTNYGDAERSERLDLTELRLAAGSGKLHVLARTSAMKKAGDAALLLLVDVEPGDEPRRVPFASGLTTARAELAFLLTGTTGRAADLRTGEERELPTGSVATNPRGWTNAIEAALPGGDLPERIGVAAAVGRPEPGGRALADLGPGPEVANVAFRREPVREWFDREQALALHSGRIDGFFERVALRGLRRGVTQRYVPGPGYHDRIFQSSPRLSAETGLEGILQHYGLYLPSRLERRAPLQLWLHWRGGTAHAAGHTIPAMFEELGRQPGAIVVSPRGRGTAGWYVGRSHADVQEVWRDVHAAFRIDRRQRYVAGHSMGGWGSFLMSITHPDWFAAALPASPPVTQGAWTGVDFEGCDELAVTDAYTPCYFQANGGDARAQHSRRMLENLRHVPVAVYHGVADEFVPYAGVARQVERLVQLGYRHRFYSFPAQEHYGPPVWDEWSEGARYLHRFTRPKAPARVSHVRDMAFERAIERVNGDGLGLDFDFDSAYWLADVEPVDAVDGRATFEGRTLALPPDASGTALDAAGPASGDQVGPWVMTGLRWLPGRARSRSGRPNAFEATLTGARAVTLRTRRMRLDARRPITGTIDTEAPLTLTLRARYADPPRVTVDGRPVRVRHDRWTIRIALPAGRRTLAVRPR